jgi:hypothetical protein
MDSVPSASQHSSHVPCSGAERAPSRSTNSSAIDIFSLPLKARNEIYKHTLVLLHPLYISKDTGARVETFAPDKPPHCLALLHTNQQMKNEASAVLYGENKFVFLEEGPQQFDLLKNFLDCIGPENTSSLSHVCINFPISECQPQKLELRDDGMQSLKLLQERCTGLKTMSYLVSSKDFNALSRMNQETPHTVREALLAFDAQLKAISLLEKVIITFYNGKPSPTLMESMRNLGWIVQPANKNQWQ